jgi:hypothetical protein
MTTDSESTVQRGAKGGNGKLSNSVIFPDLEAALPRDSSDSLVRDSGSGSQSPSSLHQVDSGSARSLSINNGHIDPDHSSDRTVSVHNEVLLDPDEPWPWLINHHRKSICGVIYKPGKPWAALRSLSSEKGRGPNERDNASRSFRVSIAELQRMHLVKLQCKVTKHALHMYQKDQEPEDWADDVHSYSRYK